MKKYTLLFMLANIFNLQFLYAQLIAGSVPTGRMTINPHVNISKAVTYKDTTTSFSINCDSTIFNMSVYLYKGASAVDINNEASLSVINSSVEISAGAGLNFYSYGDTIKTNQWSSSTTFELGNYGCILCTGPYAETNKYIGYRIKGTQRMGWVKISFNLDDRGSFSFPVTLSITEVLSDCSAIPSATCITKATKCNNSNDGTNSVTVIGGKLPYHYVWSNGMTTSKIIAAAGNYTVTVTDNLASTCTANGTIVEPSALIITPTVQNINCFGNNNGSINIQTTGGTAPYKYLWSNGLTTNNISGIVTGSYTVTVTDVNVCGATAAIILTEPSSLQTNITMKPVSCNGMTDGALQAQPSGGTAPYRYLWSDGATTAAISGLTASNYALTVVDANGCSAIVTPVLTEPTALISNFILKSIACFGESNGAVYAQVIGGVPPYKYLWSNGVTTAGNTLLSAGLYTITISDASTCNATAIVSITSPAQLQTTTSATLSTNNNGSVSVFASGGTIPYKYVWSNGNTTANIGGLLPGGYYVTVEDAQGCSTKNSAVVTGTFSINVTTTAAKCYNDSGTAIVNIINGYPPYKILWSNSEATAKITALAGTYSVGVVDSMNKIGFTTASITAPTQITTTVNTTWSGGVGSANIVVMGGTPTYQYAWSNGETISSISGLSIGTYYVTVQDQNGCMVKDTAIVKSNVGIAELNAMQDLKLWPNPVTEGVLHIEGTKSGDLLELYNILGEKVMQCNAAPAVDISAIPTGVYTLVISNKESRTMRKVIIQ